MEREVSAFKGKSFLNEAKKWLCISKLLRAWGDALTGSNLILALYSRCYADYLSDVVILVLVDPRPDYGVIFALLA